MEGPAARPIRVLLAERRPVILEGLRSVLGRCPDMQIVGDATHGGEAITRAVALTPDVVIMDVELAGADALTVVRNLRMSTPGSKVIWFAPSERRSDFVEAMKLGCAGILLKDAQVDLIPKSIRRVHAGEVWLDSATTASIIRQLAAVKNMGRATGQRMKTLSEKVDLSEREHQVTILVVQGYKNKDIANRMFITEQTVKNHIHNVFDKLGVSDRLELALYAVYHNMHLQP